MTKRCLIMAGGTGGHVFSRTLEEHNANAAKWRQLRPRPSLYLSKSLVPSTVAVSPREAASKSALMSRLAAAMVAYCCFAACLDGMMLQQCYSCVVLPSARATSGGRSLVDACSRRDAFARSLLKRAHGCAAGEGFYALCRRLCRQRSRAAQLQRRSELDRRFAI